MLALNIPYPWHTRQWSELVRVSASGRLPHAILFSAREGVGVEELSKGFAHYLLCEAPADGLRPCGNCRGCSLFAAGTHPDYKTLLPADEGKAILIDQVRELADFFSLKSHYGRGKVVRIYPADDMNRAAANAILKVLEEPPAGGVLLLAVNRFSAVPMTIRSRCVRVPCEHVDPQSARAWLAGQLPQLEAATHARLLAQSGGAPLAALALASGEHGALEADILEAFTNIHQGRTHALVQAQEFAGLPLQHLLRALVSVTTRLIMAKFGRGTFYEGPEDTPDPSLQGLADHLNLKHLYAFLDLLFEWRAVLARHSGFRDADVAESLWLGLADAAGNGGG